ncbi:DUF6541 family protein [Raoultibacter phocaeensis]|uniref:DUF6541 family protein n=1 Tax=Raoultibacter phocaeensis TaxID=2479841 RepID=UPI00111B3F3F|nr:DUF6541 family protein [Raoultibacter phocaeensis]
MWDTFFLSVAVGVLFLYAPGYLCLRAFKLPHAVSVACAPLVTIVAYSLLPIAYERFGIASSWESVVLPVFGCSLLLFALIRVLVRPQAAAFGADPNGAGARFENTCVQDARYLALYAALGIAVTSCVFMGTFDDAASFVQEFDNVHHINTIRAFLDSGIWSSMSSTLYPENITSFQPPFSGSAFYPSAWHCLATLLVDALGVPVALGANAVNFMLCAIVFPCSMFVLMRKLFAARREVLLFGAFTSLAFIAFPWKLLAWGPLLPNLTAFSLLPAVLFCFVSLFSIGTDRRARIASGCLFFTGSIALVFSQPNAVFSAGVLLIPFCIDRIRSACEVRADGNRSHVLRCKALFVGLFVIVVAAVWIGLFNAPFMSGVVSYVWKPLSDVPQALAHVLLYSSKETVAQAVLGMVVAVGFVRVLTIKGYRWIAASYAIMCFLFVAAASFGGLPKQLLTGFWYTDALRITAGMIMIGVPLASVGLQVVAATLIRGAQRVRKGGAPGKALSVGMSVSVAVAFAAVNYYPGYLQEGEPGPTSAFSASNNFLHVAYSLSGPKLYGVEEIAFIEKAKRVVPEGSLILNEPNDGSVFAYGANDVNVYERYVSGWGGETESEESKIIRRSLDVIASDPSVADAVRSLGAEYVLQLDQNGKHDGNHFLFSYEANDWFGIDRIDDSTPGFEIVLAEGDMRLYRIVLSEDA